VARHHVRRPSLSIAAMFASPRRSRCNPLGAYEAASRRYSPCWYHPRATMVKVAWLQTLLVETGRQDLMFGQFVNVRTGTECVIGPFMNVIPVWVKCKESWTRRQLLEAIQSQHAQTCALDSMGWKDIVSWRIVPTGQGRQR
jgi:hypothetical protein